MWKITQHKGELGQGKAETGKVNGTGELGGPESAQAWSDLGSGDGFQSQQNPGGTVMKAYGGVMNSGKACSRRGRGQQVEGVSREPSQGVPRNLRRPSLEMRVRTKQ